MPAAAAVLHRNNARIPESRAPDVNRRHAGNRDRSGCAGCPCLTGRGDPGALVHATHRGVPGARCGRRARGTPARRRIDGRETPCGCAQCAGTTRGTRCPCRVCRRARIVRVRRGGPPSRAVTRSGGCSMIRSRDAGKGWMHRGGRAPVPGGCGCRVGASTGWIRAPGECRVRPRRRTRGRRAEGRLSPRRPDGEGPRRDAFRPGRRTAKVSPHGRAPPASPARSRGSAR